MCLRLLKRAAPTSWVMPRPRDHLPAGGAAGSGGGLEKRPESRVEPLVRESSGRATEVIIAERIPMDRRARPRISRGGKVVDALVLVA